MFWNQLMREFHQSRTSKKMEKMYRCCLLVLIFVAAVQVDSLTGLKTQDFVKSNRITTLEDMREMSPHQRSRRAVTLSEVEMNEIVDKHNAMRRMAGASDMYHMKWNSYLATMADDWADRCTLERGQPNRDVNTLPYNPIGQNLYTTKTIDLASAIQSWYNESEHYDYDNNSCTGECSQYLQVVWAESREVGCGYKVCDAGTGTYLVCYYGPAANTSGGQPFTKGDNCTACPSGDDSCDNGLCLGGIMSTSPAPEPETSPDESATAAGATAATATAAEATAKDATAATATTAEATVTDATAAETTAADATAAEATVTDATAAETTAADATAAEVTTNAAVATTPESALSATTANSAAAVTTTANSAAAVTTTAKSADVGTTAKSADIVSTTAQSAAATTQKSTGTTPESLTNVTTATPPSGPCASVTCLHGGTAQVQQDKCKCLCSADWQGTTCEASRAEAKIGVILKIRAKLETWTTLWGFIKPIIVDAINGHCNDHVSSCCPGGEARINATFLEFLTAVDVKVGTGYPQSENNLHTLALIYAGGAPNNSLCESAKGGRSRRSIELGSSLPQAVIMSAVNSVKGNLTEKLADCCNATLDAVSAAVVAVDPTEGPGVPLDDDDKLDDWAIALIVFAAILIVGLVIVVVIWAVSRSKKKTGPSSQSGSGSG